MVVPGQDAAAKSTSQSHDKPQRRKKGAVTVPASWKLTSQQQAFIDSFTEDSDKKS